MKTETLNTITRAIGKVKFTLIKHSPTIALVSGVVLMTAGAVMACKATIKATEVASDSKAAIDIINDSAEKGITPSGETYSEEDHVRDLKIQYSKTIVSFAKLYAIPAVMFAGGVACVVAGHRILNSRNIALSTAYAGLKKAYDQFEGRVKEKYGEEEARKLKYGIKALPVANEDGTESTETVDAIEHDPSELSRFFDESSRYYTKDPYYNKLFLKSQQALMNHRLIAQGYLFLNEVMEALGFDPTPEGQVLGWIYDKNDDSLKNFVDFGVNDIYNIAGRRIVNKDDPCLLMDFNVDGPILNRFKNYIRK